MVAFVRSMESYSIPPVSSWFDDRDWTADNNLKPRDFSDPQTVNSLAPKSPEESTDTYVDFFASNCNSTGFNLPPLVCPIARRPAPTFLDLPDGNEPHTLLVKNDAHPAHRQDPLYKQKRPHECNICGKRFPR